MDWNRGGRPMRSMGPRGRSTGRRHLRRASPARPAAADRRPARKPPGNRAEKSEARRQAIVQAALEEFCARGFAAARLDDIPVRAVIAHFFEMFVQEIYSTQRRNVLRLVMTEGPRFPELAQFYYRNVVERAITAMRALLVRARERGELADDRLVRFPQLIIAPALV